MPAQQQTQQTQQTKQQSSGKTTFGIRQNQQQLPKPSKQVQCNTYITEEAVDPAVIKQQNHTYHALIAAATTKSIKTSTIQPLNSSRCIRTSSNQVVAPQLSCINSSSNYQSHQNECNSTHAQQWMKQTQQTQQQSSSSTKIIIN